MRAASLLFVAVAAVLAAATPPEPRIAVVVHPTRHDALRVEDVAAIFLRTRRFWDDGAAIVPLNRDPGSTVRETFTRRVLGGNVARLAAYWNEQYFRGVFPPAVVDSAAALKRWVATDRDAIGYLAADEVDDSVRVVLMLGVRAGGTPPLPATASP
jgi:ABC-type phosphate transport system substrate-binding protein